MATYIVYVAAAIAIIGCLAYPVRRLMETDKDWIRPLPHRP